MRWGPAQNGSLFYGLPIVILNREHDKANADVSLLQYCNVFLHQNPTLHTCMTHQTQHAVKVHASAETRPSLSEMEPRCVLEDAHLVRIAVEGQLTN